MSVSAPHLSAELTAIMSARSSKLSALQRGSFPTQTHSDQGFLIELGKWFLTRVLQIWSQREVTGAALSIGIPPSDPYSPIRPSETLALILPGECKIDSDPRTGAGIGGGIGVGVGGDSEVGMDVEGPLSLKSNGQAGGVGGGRDRGQDSGPSSCSGTFRLTDDAWAEIEEESDEGVPDADVIDPLAYRVPCPRSSGGKKCKARRSIIEQRRVEWSRLDGLVSVNVCLYGSLPVSPFASTPVCLKAPYLHILLSYSMCF